MLNFLSRIKLFYQFVIDTNIAEHKYVLSNTIILFEINRYFACTVCSFEPILTIFVLCRNLYRSSRGPKLSRKFHKLVLHQLKSCRYDLIW